MRPSYLGGMEHKGFALVTGANRGIGREIVSQLASRGWHVIATGRSEEKLRAAFRGESPNVRLLGLDVTSDQSCADLALALHDNPGKLDVLINNAGVMGDAPLSSFDLDQIHHVMEVNFYGPVRVTKYLMPLLERSDDPRIINFSSQMSALGGGTTGQAAYRLSKWSLNGFTLLGSAEFASRGIKVFSMCPGWVRTDMGGSSAPRTTAQGADTAVWLAESPEPVSGRFYQDRRPRAFMNT